MPYFRDRVKDTTTTTGTGAITLADTAPTGFRTFATAFGSDANRPVPYVIEGGSEWEVGIGTFNGTTGLTRDQVLSSSNSNALVNFSAGTKNVWCDFPAEAAENSNISHQIAVSRVMGVR